MKLKDQPKEIQQIFRECANKLMQAMEKPASLQEALAGAISSFVFYESNEKNRPLGEQHPYYLITLTMEYLVTPWFMNTTKDPESVANAIHQMYIDIGNDTFQSEMGGLFLCFGGCFDDSKSPSESLIKWKAFLSVILDMGVAFARAEEVESCAQEALKDKANA